MPLRRSARSASAQRLTLASKPCDDWLSGFLRGPDDVPAVEEEPQIALISLLGWSRGCPLGKSAVAVLQADPSGLLK